MGVTVSKKANVVHPVQNDRWRPSKTSTLVFGRHEKTIRARLFHPYDSLTMTKPTVSAGTPWRDNRFSLTIDRDENPSWKRPTDYATEIRLFDTNINRYSVKQGQVSDCFFLSTLSAIADHPEYIKQIIPLDAYETELGKYNGVFHGRFWWMGEWIDVYTDDLLPYNDDIDRVQGGHSDDENVVWVPLMEKALARLCGSYQAVIGDQEKAYVLMTGGLVERLKIIKREQKDEILSPDSVFAQVQQAFNSGSTVLTSINEKEANSPHLKGLVTQHAYAIHAALQIQHRNGTAKLLRIRNPWGEMSKAKPINANGDWKGRWSYGSSEWNDVSDDLRQQHNVQIDKGGEFWVCVEDFCEIFEHVYIADTIPHFDEDGFRKSDQLNKVINILGEWHGETAAGDDRKHIFKNPRFLLIIPNQGLNKDKKMPVVLQLIQQHDHPVTDFGYEKDRLYCDINVFRIAGEDVRDNQLYMGLNDISIMNACMGSREIVSRYKLTPGRYLLVPNYLEKYAKLPVSRSFCIRVFTATDVECRQLLEYPVALTGTLCETFENIDGSLMKRARAINVFGEWKGESAAGSDPLNRLKNPRFILNIPGNRKARIGFQLRQRIDIEKTLHCRLDVFKIDSDVMRNNNRWMLLNQIANKDTVTGRGEVSYDFELASGKYLLLPFYSDKDRIYCSFCIRILAFTDIQCGPQTENLVIFKREAEHVLEYENQRFKLEKIDPAFGEWVLNVTAGGQISSTSFNRNPQYELSITGNAPQPVLIDLLQERVEPIYAIGCHIIQIDEDQYLPVGRGVLRKNAQVKTIDGKTHPCMRYSEASGHYMLPPGRYLVVVYAFHPTDEKKFALVIAAQAQSKIRLTGPK